MLTRDEDPDGRSVGARLAAVNPDLNVAVFHEMMRRGQEAHDHTTANHPVTAHGWYRWSEMTRSGRDLLAPADWRAKNEEGVELIVSPDEAVAFYVAGGNRDTGKEHRIPSTKNRRGNASIRKVHDPNQVELLLVGAKKADEMNLTPTWLLLYLYCETDDREFFRAEFSLPAKTDAKGRIIGWTDRIIIPELELTHTIKSGERDESESEVEVPIRRKGA